MEGVQGKKLIDAGYFWATNKNKKPDKVSRKFITNLPKQLSEDPVQESFEVLHQNWKSFMFFQMVNTQWRRTGMGEISALDYSALAVPLSFYSKKKQKKLFYDVRMIECGALKGIRENG